MEKLTNKDLIGLLNGIQIMEQKAYTDIDELKPTILYKLVRNRKTVMDELNVFEDGRIKLVEELGRRKKNGDLVIKDNVVAFTKKNQEIFSKGLQELIMKEVEVEFDKFEPSQLEESGLAKDPKENQFLPIVMEYLVG